MREEVEKVLEAVRPFLQADGGDVELVDVSDDGIVRVRLTGDRSAALSLAGIYERGKRFTVFTGIRFGL